ncbi:12-(S)-hydroxy-5,8,10,14-eicosatetraenoic acid receptor-like [Cololabis saira]|uniref:12-(S)-hydroxy-5,8,10,14-eicosatetraenoic acid receptor-like n=1 Tax=Cololabis saira TaxID=129043 RepID=UPI002AD53856|nr:12-(S)-hydroxy-5,8,10,14-eicosatetraenoic acid receptor-like [Cololabis saira]
MDQNQLKHYSFQFQDYTKTTMATAPEVSFSVKPNQQEMFTDPTIDDCDTPHQDTYTALSWLMVGQFVLGLPLNLSVLYIFLFRFKFWKNKSIFLFNIVLADFLLVACLPIKIYHYQHGVRRSQDNVVCKMMLFMLFLNRGASIAFLITLSLDRYFNVVHLGRKNCVKVLKRSPLISVVIWLLLLPLTIPTMVNTFECCNSHGREKETPLHDVTDTFREIVFFTQILFPFVVLVYCTARIVSRLRKKTVGEMNKLRRAVFVVVSVVIVFSICFLPCAIARAALLTVRLNFWEDAEKIVVQVYDSLMVLSYSDCLLDPLVYCFCHSGFKNAYISTFFPAFLRKRLISYDNGVGTATTTISGIKLTSLAAAK